MIRWLLALSLLPAAAWAQDPTPQLKPVHAPRATWPAEIKQWSEGPVTCKVAMTVAEDGRTASAQAKDCPEAFASEAEKIAKKWAFEPADPPQEVTLNVAMHFMPPKTVAEAPEPVTEQKPLEEITLIHAPVPTATEAAVAGAPEGRVVCTAEVTLKKSGAPKTISLTSCDPALEDAAVKALRKWRWQYTGSNTPNLDGHTTTVKVVFRPPR